MEHTITVSEQTYKALQRQAARSHRPMNALVEDWLKQRLDLARYPELEWRQGPGGWRVGIKGAAIDVHSVVGYSCAGYSPQEISDELLPRLSLEQVRAALRYYAEYPDEIDSILAQGEAEAVKAQLYRTLGPAGYQRLTGLSGQPRVIQETRARYDQGDEGADECD